MADQQSVQQSVGPQAGANAQSAGQGANASSSSGHGGRPGAAPGRLWDFVLQAAHGVAQATRKGAPHLAAWAARFGNWLVSIGWGKFVLLSLLLIVTAALLESVVQPPWPDPEKPDVKVDVHVDDKGLHIAAPDGQGAKRPRVQIGERGVRMRGKQDGHDVSVVIDDNGVRVEGTRPNEAASPAAAPGAAVPDAAVGSVTVPAEKLSDPAKAAEALDAAKDHIRQIIEGEVEEKVAASGQAAGSRHRWVDFADVAVVLTFMLLIVRIALGSKRRAETRAEAADAAAAEEGLKRQLAEARLTTMQAQVEPHFLFNTLASVDYLIETDPARASRMQKNLIQYLRAALPQMRQASSTLGQEIALCRSYLEILKVRMEDRLQFAVVLPAGLSSASFPPMMLQTLVENSIKHGLEPKAEGGMLALTADVIDGNVRVSVSDTGVGFGVAGLDGDGVGLRNVRERLQALFGVGARLTLEANSPSGTKATIQLPYRVDPAPSQPAAPQAPA